jgi:hypothetical protein
MHVYQAIYKVVSFQFDPVLASIAQTTLLTDQTSSGLDRARRMYNILLVLIFRKVWHLLLVLVDDLSRDYCLRRPWRNVATYVR